MQKITACLWFDMQAEEAVNLYTSIFKNSKILEVSRYGEAGPLPAGTVLTITFQLNGQDFMALNGGPEFKFNEAISFYVHCQDQQEVDYYWEKLGQGGEPGPCGWLKDKFGVSWQIVPEILGQLMQDPDGEKVKRVTQAMLKMGKLDVAGLKQAYEQP
ncbi:MAG: VOC family protein [Anaerolineae bacterium]|nr:VOC family protein [Anaerolineae bacterium]